METAPKEVTYELVKSMAQRCERSKEVVSAVREVSAATRQQIRENSRNLPAKPPQFQRKCGQNLVEASSGSQSGQPKEQWNSKVKCFNCENVGHLAQECRKTTSAGPKRLGKAEEARKPNNTLSREGFCEEL